jgi:hypothetical protein
VTRSTKVATSIAFVMCGATRLLQTDRSQRVRSDADRILRSRKLEAGEVHLHRRLPHLNDKRRERGASVEQGTVVGSQAT